MADRFKYAKVRQKIIDALRTDLLGPMSEEEVLSESPKSAYIVGILEPQTEPENTADSTSEQEVEADIAYEDGADYTAGEDDE